MQDEWNIDCIVDGEAEDFILDLFERAVRGESLPKHIEGKSPNMEAIPTTKNRSTFGVVEVTRGCGRGCQFCSIALRKGRSLPLEHILENVRIQVENGADTIMLTTEDIFLYEQGPKFNTNILALRKLFESVAAVPGVKHVVQSHGTIAPIVRDPQVIEALSPVAVNMSTLQGNPQIAIQIRESFAKGGWEGFLQDQIEDRKLSNPSAYIVGTFHAALGEKDKAFAELNRSYENREYFMTLLKVDPRLDPLRDDPRFQELLRKVGFSQ